MLIFMTLVNAQRHYVLIACSKLHLKQVICGKYGCKFIYTPWLLLCQIAQQSHLLTTFCKNSFTKLHQSLTDHLITVSRSQLDGCGCHMMMMMMMMMFLFFNFLKNTQGVTCTETLAVVFTVLSAVYNFNFLFSHIFDLFNL